MRLGRGFGRRARPKTRTREVPLGRRTVFKPDGWPVRLVIFSEPATKKTSNRVVFHHGKPIVLPSEDWGDWVRAAKGQMDWIGPPLDVLNPLDPKEKWKRQPLSVEATFYLGRKQTPDLSGLYEGLGDLLEELGIIDNDYWIASWPAQDPRRRDINCPRTEVVIDLHRGATEEAEHEAL